MSLFSFLVIKIILELSGEKKLFVFISLIRRNDFDNVKIYWNDLLRIDF